MSVTLANKKTFLFITVLMAITILFTSLPVDYASAAPNPFAGVNANQTEGFGGQKLMDDMNKAVYTIYIVAGLWTLAWVIVGTIILSGSGGNPQRRSTAIVALGLALLGGVILVNAYDILGWMKT